MEIRNIAIIAHVDHGKTTLTDAIMKFTGAVEEGVSMDSNALEKERGITIYSKNASIRHKGTKINIVDTPGHQDFGSEVERVLRAIDTVLLLVDAQEGPMPQTRFVLKKSLELGLQPIVVINKIDKPAARVKEVEDEVLELFLELGATEKQCDFTTVYAIARQGITKRNLADPDSGVGLLLDIILEHVAPATLNSNVPGRCQPFNLAYDNFLGRMAICRIHDGVIKNGEDVFVITQDGTKRKAKIRKLFTFEGLTRIEAVEAQSGDIVMIAGIPDIFIGETITSSEDSSPLPAIIVDEPTISLFFLVNDSTFGGREGKFVTSRQIRERLERELEVNVGLKVDFSGDDGFKVSGRGELHIGILLENMRREGFEVQVSQPEVIIKEVDGIKNEPFEEVVIDVPKEMSGTVIARLTERRGLLMSVKSEHGGVERLIFEAPTRGLLGFRGQFIIDTKGLGILSSRFIGFRKYLGEIKKQEYGAMISMMTGKCLAFALDNLQQRGTLYVEPGDEVYEGQVIGNTSKGEDLYVNPTKGKQLTNMRASGSDHSISLAPAWKASIERTMEIMREDEYMEVTPASVRLRKKILTQRERSRAESHREK
ncbi:MAG: GTP-binding protein TypA [Candidatus Ryanbacteria bacterium RIFCSPHIGHO2_02_FULL_45_43]|uniref:50S ribosomal subunit assembly factor BipA n=1 Tax=Candidatus Ryanbacteria bacterium RIFCSPHIGHO2_01_45_13 TaxID=1802112 RepID=A0A1G2G103_9BACT|nr:MAG: GTP-binding protein TypA [Candidatus Ryanbacteria bacterium RIFCSPHIGHO2_01_FULL_44_130]OGZ43672.1 MAG: GTP-binding protein TypA [Candidatus Ryanbacteria bacterium RIFCSPHIGHO2_01_45_13]OGZ49155.1 MAG: GTP-binding protein TypA [Candidatus Ryanbacteria bacterium RIFCSPHIGHO2_02_FULL_45_43]OGZ50937.1 MAG: GTP-binding protein TypA [Candidatus Ryanbacteria bacterium RIFCSPHIGHO2_12_FULL_44_20]OGZ51416.1 MAG: GTP-binding protein TypA [Candidatus Ryanbacteria bacterium RIFCSPLOWO2_01_FULL_44_